MNNTVEKDLQKGICLSPSKVVRLLGWIVFSLVVTHLILQAIHYYVYELPWLLREIFDVDEEESFPNWFSAILLFASSVLLFLITRIKENSKEPFIMHWYGLAFGFGVLSIDEVAGMHETFNTLTDFAWTIPALFLALVLLLIYWKFLIHLPQLTRSQFWIAGSVFLGGAVVVEHVADYYVEAFEMDNFGYQVMTALEETLEMVGVIIFIRVLLIILRMDNQGKVPIDSSGKLTDMICVFAVGQNWTVLR